jgi:quercetin dioxygenase-like cupin family protein
MRIIRASQQLGEKEPGRTDRFTGLVDFERVKPEPIILDSSGTVRMMRSSFEASSRSYWHTHPGGQILYVESGRGKIGWREPSGDLRTEIIEQGDLAFIRSGEDHWHGGSPDNAVVHLAIHSASSWATGRPVSDAEYLG